MFTLKFVVFNMKTLFPVGIFELMIVL